jgi:phosphatidylethanolamine/phosphatidyl-N-methylethanolamine N-methyltransferase
MGGTGHLARSRAGTPTSPAMTGSSNLHDRDTLDQRTLNRAYARWAPIYDVVFGAVFDQGRKASIEAAERIGGRILDVGIGTGISLLDFSSRNRIVGVDISEPMLRRARRRVIEAGLANVECLAVMDAERLGFPDGFFDVVVAQYVITAVPNPDATLTEFARVTKPGGEIILVNHIGAESGPRRAFEQSFAPIARGLGWRPEFPFARIAAWTEQARDVSLIERRPMPPLGHFSLIRMGKRG